MDETTQALVGRAGSLSQLGSLILIALFVGALARSRPRQHAFHRWALAWACFAVALAAIVLRYSWSWGESPLTEDAVLSRALYYVYGGGKLAFLALLASGTASFTGARSHGLGPGPVAGLGAALGFAIAFVARDLNTVMAWQSAFAFIVFSWCTALLWRLPLARRTLGTRALVIAFASHGVLWGLYGLAFAAPILSGGASPFPVLLAFNSYMDAVLQTLLAYGMVLVVMEDAAGETERAHTSLAAAHAALQQAAYADPLTGLYNRKAFVDGVGLGGLTGVASTVAVVDVDNLKPVNDSLGHHAGDALISRLAAGLRECLRPGDSGYRWGGDEFLFVFPGLGMAEVSRVLDAALARHAAVSVDGVVLPVRASYGCATATTPDDLAQAISEADRSMYHRKATRRSETPAGGIRVVS